MKQLIIIIGVIFIFIAPGQGQTHSDGLFQNFPASLPKVFASGQISFQNEYEFGSTITKDYDEIYIGVRLNENWKAEIRSSELKNGKWTVPERLNLNPKYTYNDPFLNNKEDKLFFVSNMPLGGEGEPKDFDIWYLQKTESGWSEPIHTGEKINSEKDEFYVTISNNGSMYFVSNRHTKNEDDRWNHDIYYSELMDGKYQEPVRLNNVVNSESFECDPYISPNESYLIFCSSRPGGFGEGDLYICFKGENGEWDKPINMGERINTSHHEFCPMVTKDGKYFFYTSKGDIYWIDAKIIRELNNIHFK